MSFVSHPTSSFTPPPPPASFAPYTSATPANPSAAANPAVVGAAAYSSAPVTRQLTSSTGQKTALGQ